MRESKKTRLEAAGWRVGPASDLLGLTPEEADMATTRSVICIDPEIMSGTPVFAGTRVPVQALLDYLKAGDRIDDFLDQFPTVTRKMAEAFLELAGQAVMRVARASR